MALESNNKNVRVVACIVRPNMDIDLGLELRQDDSRGCLIVESVDPDGLFAKTGIAVNQTLVKIMGRNCSNRSRNKLEKALEVLQNAKGLITLETESTATAAPDESSSSSSSEETQIFSIQKATKSFKLGIEVEKIEAPDDQLRIIKTSPTLERVLGIKPGLQLLKINGIRCQYGDIQSVYDAMDFAFPILSLECIATVEKKEQEEIQKEQDNTRVVACISRPETFLDLGLSFLHDTERDCLVVKSVSPNGLFANTGLKVNQKVVKINGHPILKKKFHKAEDMLQNTPGRLIVETETSAPANNNNNSTIVLERQTFSIQKDKKGFKLGLGLEQTQKPDGSGVAGIRISTVSPVFQKVLGLKPGLQLLRINGAPINAKDVSSIHEQMDQAFPILSIECLATIHQQEEEREVDSTRVVACIIQPEIFSDLGVTFRQDVQNQCLMVDSVASNGLLANTGLMANQRVSKVNGHRISKKRFDKAEEMMQNTTGRLILETESFPRPAALDKPVLCERQTFSIQKTQKAFSLGLGLEQLKTPEGFASGLRIVSVSPICEKVLGLKQGAQLLKINGAPCNPNDIPSVHEQMDQAFPILSIECLVTIEKAEQKPPPIVKEEPVTVPEPEPEPEIVEEEEKKEDNVRVITCITRADTSVDLGISFRQDAENGCLIVDSVSPDGLFAGTGLEAEQKIVKINGRGIHKKKLNKAEEILQAAKGRIIIEAEKLSTTPDENIYTENRIFSIEKPTPAFQLGLVLGLEQSLTSPDQQVLKIVKASPTLERILGLKQGMQLLKINGVPCKTNEMQSAYEQMDKAFPLLSLECLVSVNKQAEAEEATRLHAEEKAKLKAQEQARLEAEEEARLAAEAKAKAEEEARLKAEEEARLAAEAKAKAEEEARLKAEEEARIAEEARRAAEAKAKAEEEARQMAEEEKSRKKAEEEEALLAEQEAWREAEEKARLQAEEEARKKAQEEEEWRQAKEQARLQAEEDARLRKEAEEKARLEAEEQARLKAAEEAKARESLPTPSFDDDDDEDEDFEIEDVDELIRQAELRQANIEAELLDLGWD